MMLLSILPGTGRGTSSRLVEGAGHKRRDRVGHRTGIRDHTAGGNPNDAIPLLAQEPQAGFIPRRTIGTVMCFTVDLNDQPRFTAVKVDHIGADRMLATKLRACFAPPQLLPQHGFGRRQGAAQAASERHLRT
ncbi:hypothetical protein ASE59_09880 [Sphingomonas sp. Leaf10]|nr:hypothetical protein ASE59_09880 [Sphingomonas sp. Leaf10]